MSNQGTSKVEAARMCGDAPANHDVEVAKIIERLKLLNDKQLDFIIQSLRQQQATFRKP